jgi:hypothetical protein
MRRGSIAALVVSLGALMAPQVAAATVFVGQTNLTIHVQQDRITGMLVGRPECRGDQPIDLYVAGVHVDTTNTDGAGHYAFSYTSVPPTTVQTRFAGSQSGSHPDRFICTPSESRVVVIDKVKTAQGPAKPGSSSRAAISLARRVDAISMQAMRSLFRSWVRA